MSLNLELFLIRLKGELDWEKKIKEVLDKKIDSEVEEDEYTLGYCDGRIELLEIHIQILENWIKVNKFVKDREWKKER